jgi:hypothetical protein
MNQAARAQEVRLLSPLARLSCELHRRSCVRGLPPKVGRVEGLGRWWAGGCGTSGPPHGATAQLAGGGEENPSWAGEDRLGGCCARAYSAITVAALKVKGGVGNRPSADWRTLGRDGSGCRPRGYGFPIGALSRRIS